MRALVCAVVMLVALQSRAAADTSKAWAAARDNLPAQTRAIGAIDVAAIVKSAAYARLFELVMKEERDVREAYTLIKKACQVDPAAVIEGVVVAGDPAQDRGVVFLQLALDRAKVTACLEAALKAIGEARPQIKFDGNIAAISVGRDTAYVAWVTPDVVAISLEPEKKDALQAWIGQKGAFARSTVPAQLSKVDTKAAAWGALALDRPLVDDYLQIVSAHGAVTLSKGTIAGSLRGTFVNAKVARDTHAEIQKDFAKELNRKRTPDPVKRVIKAIGASVKGAEVALTGSVTEADLLGAMTAVMK